MTPFMQQVDAVLIDGAVQTPVATAPVTPRPLGAGLHHQVELRALAEQLVCEANAVLADHDLRLELIDIPDRERLAFSLVCGRRRAWLVTDVIGRTARARLDAPILGAGEREILGPDALVDLLLNLIAAERAGRSGR